MRPTSHRVLLTLTVGWLALLGWSAAARAAEVPLFGPAQYTRTSGPPNQFSETVALPPTLAAPFRLHVQNGNPDGTSRISSARIHLNGVEVAGPADFAQPAAGFDRTVMLQASNTLQVRLMSGPGGFLALTLYASVPPPTLTRLEPPSLPVTEGATGLLAATISAVQPEATVVALESTDPTVASVPAGVTVPAGQLTAEIPVAGVAPGTAWVRASLHGTSLQSAVTVRPSGPTLTDLAPATLQITQGASGTLTLALSAAQATDTLVPLASSDPAIVGLPPGGSVTVPAGQLRQAFAVFGGSPGTAMITASLNGSLRTSQVTVVIPLPTVVSLLPPVLPLTEGSSGTLTVTLNAAQPTATDVLLATSDATVAGLPADRVTVPAGALTGSFAVTGLARGAATVIASLNGTSATAAVTVEPPPPTAQALACPPRVTQGATGLCTVTLNATQLVDTAVPVASAPEGILGHAGTLTVPANHLTATFTVTGLAVGETALTVGPLNGTSRTAGLQVVPPPPTIVSLVPQQASLLVGASIGLTLTLNAAQLDETAVPLASAPGGVLGHPAEVRVPAGALAAVITLTGLTPGVATVMAGPLTGTSAQSVLTVNQLPPLVTALAPSSLSLAKGRAGTLTLTIAPTQPEATVVLLTSSAPGVVEVPGNVTVPAGAETAAIPVLAKGEGEATVTAGPLNGSSRQVLVAVTPAELVTLALTPPAPAVPKGGTQAFTASGAYTDGTTRDVTGTAAWTSSDPLVAPISAAGVATALAEGQVTITATVGSQGATASLTVTPPVLASLTLVPADATRFVGETLQLQAVGTLTDGTTRDETANVATWTSSDPLVATVDAGGLVAAVSAGIASITATHLEGYQATAMVTVRLPPPTLTRFEPTTGKAGTTVTLTGTNLDSTSAVAFNGAPAQYTVVSPTQVTTVVPAAATTGAIAVTAAGGTATSAAHFIVLPTYDFSLMVAPGTATVIAGTSASFTVQTVTTGGYTGLTQLGVTGLPTGVSASFAPPLLGPNALSVLTLTTIGSTQIGSVPVEVRGTAQVEATAVARTATAVLSVQAPGQTVLTGQVRDEQDRPLPGVSLRYGWNPPTTLGTTDAGGNFLVTVPATGALTILVDGSTVSRPAVSYATIPVTVTVQAGAVNTLGYVPRLVPQAVGKTITLTPGGPETVLAPADIPGLEVRIPAGTTITGWDGQPNTEIGVVAVPMDRSGAPPLPGGLRATTVYAYYFGKVGGGTPSQPVPVTFPNELGLEAGEQADLYYYDELPDGSQVNTWRKYGTGTVSADGTKIVPDINPATGKPYGVPRFCCGYQTAASIKPDTARCPYCTEVTRADPVELQTGLFLHFATDLVLPDRLPVVLARTHRTNGFTYGPFGSGSSLDVNLLLVPPRNGSVDQLILKMPGDSLNPFVRQPDGSFQNLANPAFRGARVTLEGGNRILRFKDGRVWTFRGSDGLLLTQADRHGNTLTLERNDLYGRVSRIVGPTGRWIRLTYRYDDGPIQEATDDRGRTVQYAYDGWRLASVTDPLGQVTRYTYDGSGRHQTIVDPRNVTVVRNEYDAAGRVSRQTRPDNAVWQFAYTLSGGTITSTTVTDPRGGTTTHRFNADKHVVSATDAQGQPTTQDRAVGSNLLLRSTDPLGRSTRYTYDDLGNVRTVTDPLNQTTTFTYHPTWNLVTAITDPLGHLTTFEYDGQGNLVAITDPEQNLKPDGERRKTTFTYNDSGQPLTATDPLGHPTTFTYTAHGDLETITDPLQHTTTRTYDAAQRLLAQTDALGRTTRYTYDDLDRLTGIVDPLGGTTFFEYDPNGNLLTVTDAKGRTTRHSYDAMNRLETRTDPLGRLERFTYDPAGNLRTHTDRKGQVTTHTYDAQGRRTRSEYGDGSWVSFTYDAAGNLLTATDSLTGTITRTYDPVNRLLTETSPQGTVAYAYDAAGRRTTLQASGGAPAVTYGYDANSRLTGIVQGPQTVVALDYDAANRRTLLTLPNGVATAYEYDEASRLIAQVYRNALGVLGDLTYQYDPTGNRIGTGGSWARTLLPAAVPTADYDAANAQLAFGDATQTFDANGNLETQTDAAGTTTFTWDARNRLVAINGPTITTSFAYDALGRRITKTINGTMTSFLYDGLDAVVEQGAEGQASYLRTLAIDEALVRSDSVGPSTYLADILGSTVALADAAGTPSTTYAYAPFGETSVSGVPSANAFQYTGREHDGTGLYYYRARYYDPIRSRFVSADPLGLGGGINMFVYVHNGPTGKRDPYGLQAENCDHGTSKDKTCKERAQGEYERCLRNVDRVGTWATGACLAGAVTTGAAAWQKSGNVAIGVGVGVVAGVACLFPSWEDLAIPSGKKGCDLLRERIYQMCMVE